jgi:hypothetical protein
MLLLDNVETLVFEHLTENFEYDPNWPPLNTATAPRALPKMIRVTIELESGSETTKLFPGVHAQ